MPLLEPQFARTVRCLELMAKMHAAYVEGDTAGYDALSDQALAEAGPETVVFISGGMRIGEIPEPDHKEWFDYLEGLRARLAAETAEDEG